MNESKSQNKPYRSSTCSQGLEKGLARAHSVGSAKENYYNNRFNSIVPCEYFNMLGVGGGRGGVCGGGGVGGGGAMV